MRKEDWTEVNTSEDGGIHHYGVKLWPGAGYWLTLYSVWADNPMDALTIVAEWCDKHEPGMIVRAEEVHDQVEEYMAEEIKKDPSKYGLEEDQVNGKSDKAICDMLYKEDRDAYFVLEEFVWNDNAMYEWVTETDNSDLYVRSENLIILDWPDK